MTRHRDAKNELERIQKRLGSTIRALEECDYPHAEGSLRLVLAAVPYLRWLYAEIGARPRKVSPPSF